MTSSRRPLLPVAVLAVLAAATAGLAQTPPTVAFGPYVLFDTAGRAAICWQTAQPVVGSVVVEGPGLDKKSLQDSGPTTTHRITVHGLAPDSLYKYQVLGADGNPPAVGEFDTTFNYCPPALTLPGGDRAVSPDTQTIQSQSGVDRGHCVVYGLGDGRLVRELVEDTKFFITCLDESQDKIDALRDRLRKTGAYGSRLTARRCASLSQTPLPSCFANVVVADAATVGRVAGSAKEVARILRPGGTALLSGVRVDEAVGYLASAGLKAQAVSAGGKQWAVARRGALAGAGVWSHQYGTAANAAFGGETLGGATQTSQMTLQWLGRPGGDFGVDRQVRMPAPLSVGGRLYHQGMHRMAALDAYNGAVLWTMEMPALWRINIPRDTSNWCADDQRLYVAAGDKAAVFDGQTGSLMSVFCLPGAPAGYDWAYVAREGDKLYGARVKKGSFFTNWWGGGGWYDGAAGGGTNKVCSDELFTCDLKTGKGVWTYRNGILINPTIAIGDGRVYFIESRSAQAKAAGGGRLGKEIAADRFLVALNAADGKKLWETPVSNTVMGVAVYYLAYSNGHVVVMASDSAKYFLYVYGAADGKERWQARHGWPYHNHGGHMHHPVVTGQVIYQSPRGYDLKTGKVVATNMINAGCGTYSGTGAALLYRGGGYATMWDMKTGKSSLWMWLRTSCWLSMVPAGGMILAPEGGGGCSCGRWIETSVGFLPLAAEGGNR